ncbi:hypothetical protein ACQB6R_02335 [Propionibacteriaceae bacterium G1746]
MQCVRNTPPLACVEERYLTSVIVTSRQSPSARVGEPC